MENLKKKIQILLNLYKSKNLFKAELLNKELITRNPKVVNLYNIFVFSWPNLSILESKQPFFSSNSLTFPSNSSIATEAKEKIIIKNIILIIKLI